MRIPRGRLYISSIEIIASVFSRLAPIHGDWESGLKEEFRSCFGREPIFMPSCRVALYEILRNLKNVESKKVYLPPITIPDVVNAIILAGFEPVFVDVDPKTGAASLASVKERVSENGGVFLLTHLNGIVDVAMMELVGYLKEKELFVIEDISQSFVSFSNGLRVGSIGNAAVASFSMAKTVTSLGGGLCLVERGELANAIESRLGNYPSKPSLTFHFKMAFDSLKVSLATSKILFPLVTYPIFAILKKLGEQTLEKVVNKRNPGQYVQNPPLLRRSFGEEFFFRMDNSLLFLIARSFKRADRVAEKRRSLAAAFYDSLENKGIVPEMDPDGKNSYWHMPVVLQSGKEKARLRSWLFKRGVDTTGFGLANCNEIEAFSQFKKTCPNAAVYHESTLFIPNFPALTESQVREMAEIINAFFRDCCS